MTRIDTTPIDEAAEALRQARAEIVMLREVNAEQAKRIGELHASIRAYQQDTRQRMARE